MRIPRKIGILGTLAAFTANIFGCAPTELQADLPARVNPKAYYLTDDEGNRAPKLFDNYALITLDLDGDGNWDEIVWGRDSDGDRKIKENELYDLRFSDGGKIPRGIWCVGLPRQSEKKLEYPQGTLPSPSEVPKAKPIEIPAEKREEIIKRFIDSMESLEARLPEGNLFLTENSYADAVLTRNFQSFAYRLLAAACNYNKEGQDKLGVYVAIAGRGVYPVIIDEKTFEFRVGEPLGIEKMQEVERERAKRYLPQPTPPAEKPAEKPKEEAKPEAKNTK